MVFSGFSRPPIILQLVPALNSGGVERGVFETATAIINAGGKALIASSGGKWAREIERIGGVHITLPLHHKSPGSILMNAKAIAKIIQEHQVDIIHPRSRAPAWSVKLALKKLKKQGHTSCHWVSSWHGTHGSKGSLKRWYNKVMAGGEKVIAISRFIENHIQEIYKADPAKIRIVPRGVDLNIFNPDKVHRDRVVKLAQEWHVPDGKPVIMLPGRFSRWKGHKILLQALAKLGDQEFYCLFVGAEENRAVYQEELKRVIQNLGLLGRVRIVAMCRDMPAAYMLADVVVSPATKAEAFGRIAVEAQAMGRPVVASDLGGSRET
ncbi:MAG: glycosyltransferase family 4 protein, partial [Dongiaceae bacterium]